MLTVEEYEALEYGERVLLYDWTREQSGGLNQTFIPAAIRRMPLDFKMALARSEAHTKAWQVRERARVQDDHLYFIESYGSVQPPTGNPIPFEMWDVQVPVFRAMREHTKTAFPKARRMGISWGAMHYVDWICEHNPDTLYARCLILSKGLDDANEMLERIRQINELQPKWLRSEPDGKDNTREIHFGNASVKSLPATARAARSETATLVVLDEFAFVPNGQAEAINVAVEPTVEGGGQIIYVSSGNGEVGNGAEFARVCREAEAGANDVKLIFLPASARPDRDPAVIERAHARGGQALAEYAETLDEALQGDTTVHVYPRSGVGAAERLGLLLESYAQLDALFEQGIEWGTDWGDFQTFTVYACGLPGGGLYIIDELVQPHLEPEQASRNIVRHDPGDYLARDGGKLRAIRSNQDASPAGTNSTYASVVRKHRELPEYAGRIPDKTLRIPFGLYKQGGGDKGRANTVGFLQWLFRRTQKLMEGTPDLDALHGVIAIHPRCTLLLKQLRNLERDPKTGKVKKPPLDPKRPEIGDHGPDAVVALAAEPRAVQWTAQNLTDEETGNE